jgi:hypothetical protein
MKKGFLLFIIMLSTIGFIYFLVKYMGVQGFLFAWVLNFMLMMFVLMFTETLKSACTSNYFKEQNWEQKGKIYEQLGIHLFRKLLVIVGWEKLNKKENPVKNNLAALAHLEYRTKQSELGHLIIFFIVGGFSIYVAIRYSFSASAWLIFLNLVLNFYPILLQRYNRPRLQRAIQIFQRK